MGPASTDSAVEVRTTTSVTMNPPTTRSLLFLCEPPPDRWLREQQPDHADNRLHRAGLDRDLRGRRQTALNSAHPAGERVTFTAVVTCTIVSSNSGFTVMVLQDQLNRSLLSPGESPPQARAAQGHCDRDTDRHRHESPQVASTVTVALPIFVSESNTTRAAVTRNYPVRCSSGRQRSELRRGVRPLAVTLCVIRVVRGSICRPPSAGTETVSG